MEHCEKEEHCLFNSLTAGVYAPSIGRASSNGNTDCNTKDLHAFFNQRREEFVGFALIADVLSQARCLDEFPRTHTFQVRRKLRESQEQL